MGLELVEFDKGAAVEQEFDALARGQTARLALTALSVLAAAEFRLARKLAHPFDIFLNAHHQIPAKSCAASMIWFAGGDAQADLASLSARSEPSRGGASRIFAGVTRAYIMRQLQREKAGAP